MRFTAGLRSFLAGIVAFAASQCLLAAETGFVEGVFEDEAGPHKYMVFVPDGYTPDRAWPVILYLHGASERGTDGAAPLQVGPGPYLEARRSSFPFLVVFPQCESDSSRLLTGWSPDSPDGARALAILAQVERDYRVDPQKRILTGWSMGGHGTWSLAATTPDHWAAIVPVAGDGDPAGVAPLQNVRVWAIHGACDNLVRPQRSRDMVEALKTAGGAPILTEVADTAHEVWQIVYDNDAVYNWMLDPAAPPPELVRPDQLPPLPDSAGEFAPAVEISNALSVDISNQLLDAISYSIPGMVDDDVLNGTIPDIYETTRVMGLRFRIQFTRIRYTGRLVRARARSSTGRIGMQFGLRDVRLTIGACCIRGALCSANTGAIHIVIGHKRPVWLDMDVSPYVNNQRELALRLLGSRFQIPRDNWYVTAPAGVSTSSLLMSRSRVSRSIVQGLYSRKRRIEQQVTDATPEMVSWMEDQLQLTPDATITAGIWPLPAYRPRVRVWPETIRTGEDGVHLTLGVSAASPDPRHAPAVPEQFRASSDWVRPADASTFHVAIATDALEPLSRMLIDNDVARFNVLDVPEFEALADRAQLETVLPALADLPDTAAIDTVVRLLEPLAVEPVDEAPQPNADHQRLQVHAPRLEIAIDVSPDGSRDGFQPFARFDADAAQTAEVRILTSPTGRSSMRADWIGAIRVATSGGYAADDAPADAQPDRIAELFAAGWQNWIDGQPCPQTTLSDLTFQNTVLRASDVSFVDGKLGADFGIAPTAVTNLTESELVYEVKGPYSRWGGPWTLAPGETHRFNVAYVMQFRTAGAPASQVVDLAPGVRYEFREPEAGLPPALLEAR